jgi:hypothetical protein
MTLAALVLSAAALAAVLFLFVALKREMWRRERAARERAGTVAAAVEEMRAQVASLRAQFADLEERTGMLAAPPPVRSGLNMNRRNHAVRMARRGDPPEQLAAALGLPLNEARLLSVVERLRVSDERRTSAAQ